eukprot:2138423-Amphidinium_carterae.1
MSQLPSWSYAKQSALLLTCCTQLYALSSGQPHGPRGQHLLVDEAGLLEFALLGGLASCYPNGLGTVLIAFDPMQASNQSMRSSPPYGLSDGGETRHHYNLIL